MPELPEVETVRAGLQPALTGAVVEAIEIFDQRSLRRHLGGPAEFVASLTGRTIEAVVRRGKFLWMPLAPIGGDNGTPLALVGHLGMSGQMLIREPAWEPDKLTRVVIRVIGTDGKPLEFRFVDQRLFGGLHLDVLIPTTDGAPGGFGNAPEGWWTNLIPQVASHIARDPLDANFDLSRTIAKLRTKRSGIKRVLLDQNLISGIGNIYADESLWRAKLHYDTSADSLSKSKATELLGHVDDILRAAVEVGGTSFDEQYKNVNGQSGYFEISLNAYGRTGTPCARCGTPIKREDWANRGSHFCPRCQRKR